LRQFLAERLPAYMIPSAFVTLDALPQTANGKIDRKALAARPLVADERGDGASNGSRAAAAPPRSALEQALATIWQTTLPRPAVGIHDNFFDLGGHSLLLAQVHSRLREELGVTVPMIALLEHPTISALAAYLAATERTPRSFQPSQDRARKQLDSLRRQRQSAKR
jgi:acyl carrier protein